MGRLRIIGVLVLLMLPWVCRADIAVHVTRLIHQGDERMVVERIWNKGDRPSLIQAWIDEGDREQSVSGTRPPFFATPPLFQLEPGRNRDISVRLVDAASLPSDRESLYWLNILDLPATAKSDGSTDISYAVRWRIKLFHRPTGLSGSSADAVSGLRWAVRRSGDRVVLVAQNDAPYHVSLRELQLGGDALELPVTSAVIAPLAEWSMEIPAPKGPDGLRLKGVWLDDGAEGHDFELVVACDEEWCGHIQ